MVGESNSGKLLGMLDQAPAGLGDFCICVTIRMFPTILSF